MKLLSKFAPEHLKPLWHSLMASLTERHWTCVSYILAWTLIAPVAIYKTRYQHLSTNGSWQRFHSLQSIGLGIVLWILMLTWMLLKALPFVGVLFLVLGMPVAVVCISYSLYLGLMAYRGKWIEIPWIGDFIHSNWQLE